MANMALGSRNAALRLQTDRGCAWRTDYAYEQVLATTQFLGQQATLSALAKDGRESKTSFAARSLQKRGCTKKLSWRFHILERRADGASQSNICIERNQLRSRITAELRT